MLIGTLLATSLLFAPPSPDDQATAWQGLPPLAELIAEHGPPDLPAGRDLDDLRADLDAIQHVWHATLDRKHALLAEVGDAKIARADEDVFVGWTPPPAASGALGRRARYARGELSTVDVFADDAPGLAALDRELAALHAHGERLLADVFDGPGTGPGPEPGPGPKPADVCRCPVASNSTHFNDPPEGCLNSWGVTYSIDDGACDDGYCGAAEACEGTAQISMDVADPSACGGVAFGWSYPPGQVTITSNNDDGDMHTLVFDADVTLNCGEHFVISYSAGSSYPFGQTVISCNDCLAAFGQH